MGNSNRDSVIDLMNSEHKYKTAFEKLLNVVATKSSVVPKVCKEIKGECPKDCLYCISLWALQDNKRKGVERMDKLDKDIKATYKTIKKSIERIDEVIGSTEGKEYYALVAEHAKLTHMRAVFCLIINGHDDLINKVSMV